jgi:hypothetical protein
VEAMDGRKRLSREQCRPRAVNKGGKYQMQKTIELKGTLIFRVADVILCQPGDDPVSIFDEIFHAQLEGKKLRITIEQLQ